MKHLKKGRKFSREKKQREAMLKIMIGNLFSKGRITTTLAKAKELKIISEKIIAQAKTKDNFRLLNSKLPKNIDQKTMQSIKAATSSRKSGFFRVTRKGPRLSDSAKMATIEFVDKLNGSENKKNDKE